MQVNEVERRDVVRLALQVARPEAALPEAELVHLVIAVTQWSVSVRRAANVHVVQLRQVGTHDLVAVDKDDALDVQREEYVEEEDLVRPDDALLLRLLVQPVRPLVRHKLIVKAKLLCHFRDDAPVLRRHIVPDDPKLDACLCVLDHAQDHDLLEALIHVARRNGEHVHGAGAFARGNERAAAAAAAAAFIALVVVVFVLVGRSPLCHRGLEDLLALHARAAVDLEHDVSPGKAGDDHRHGGGAAAAVHGRDLTEAVDVTRAAGCQTQLPAAGARLELEVRHVGHDDGVAFATAICSSDLATERQLRAACGSLSRGHAIASFHAAS
mmetsp:Transcript_33615/g.100093  ORF Transcript_33615/g.100093 Transcript_33615/m.100093 type:complete len:326 (-) Transcript_33615:4501-5478(-)